MLKCNFRCIKWANTHYNLCYVTDLEKKSFRSLYKDFHDYWLFVSFISYLKVYKNILFIISLIPAIKRKMVLIWMWCLLFWKISKHKIEWIKLKKNLTLWFKNQYSLAQNAVLCSSLLGLTKHDKLIMLWRPGKPNSPPFFPMLSL